MSISGTVFKSRVTFIGNDFYVDNIDFVSLLSQGIKYVFTHRSFLVR
jgi:hypothetical protein